MRTLQGSLITHSDLQPDHFPAGGHSRSVPLPSVSWRQEDNRDVPRVPSQTAQSKHGPSPSPQLLSPDSLEQDPDGSPVMLVIGDPGRDAISLWGGALKLKEQGHIFRVNDKNRLHVAKLLPGRRRRAKASLEDPVQSGQELGSSVTTSWLRVQSRGP